MVCTKIEFKKCHRQKTCVVVGIFATFFFLYIIWSTPLTRTVRRSIYQHNIHIIKHQYILYDQHLPKEKDPKVILLQIRFLQLQHLQGQLFCLRTMSRSWGLDPKLGRGSPPSTFDLLFLGDFQFWKGGVSEKIPQNVNIIEVSEKDVHSVGSIHVPASGKWSLMEVPSRVVKQMHGRKEASHLTFWAPSSSKFFRLHKHKSIRDHKRNHIGGWTSPDFQLPHLWLCELKRKNPNRFELVLGCSSEDVWYQKNPEWGWYQKK